MKKISRRARPYTITLYNYLSTSGDKAAYQRTVIGRVYLDLAYSQRLSQRGVATADTCQLIIDLRDMAVTGGRTFIAQKAWSHLSAAEKTAHFTFATANDFFVVGEVTESLPTVTKGEMVAKYQCFGISSVAVSAVVGTEAVILEVVGK